MQYYDAVSLPVYLDTRSQATGSCSRALQAMRSIRQRLSSSRSCEIASQNTKVLLVEAGLGENKVIVPDVTCSAEQFKNILVKTNPNLEDCGRFELLKCTPNRKE